MNKAGIVFITALTAGMLVYQQSAGSTELNIHKNFSGDAVFLACGHLKARNTAFNSKQKRLPKTALKSALVFVNNEIKVRKMLSHRESGSEKTEIAMSGIYFYPDQGEMTFRQKNSLTILRARK